MLALAPYPKGFKLDQTAFNYYYNNVCPVTVSEKYKQALVHYTNIRYWCTENCQGPYIIDYSDILHDGVRVRLGDQGDLAHFTLKWI